MSNNYVATDMYLLKLLSNEDAEETFSGYLYSAAHTVDAAGVVAV